MLTTRLLNFKNWKDINFSSLKPTLSFFQTPQGTVNVNGNNTNGSCLVIENLNSSQNVKSKSQSSYSSSSSSSSSNSKSEYQKSRTEQSYESEQIYSMSNILFVYASISCCSLFLNSVYDNIHEKMASIFSSSSSSSNKPFTLAALKNRNSTPQDFFSIENSSYQFSKNLQEIQSFSIKFLALMKNHFAKWDLSNIEEPLKVMGPLEFLKDSIKGAQDSLSKSTINISLIYSYFENEDMISLLKMREQELNETVSVLVKLHHQFLSEVDQNIFSNFRFQRSAIFPLKFVNHDGKVQQNTPSNYYSALHSFLSTFSNTQDPRLQKMLKKAIASLSYWVDLTSKSQQELLKIEAEEERRLQLMMWEGMSVVISNAHESHDPTVTLGALHALAAFSEAVDYGEQIVSRGGLTLMKNVVVENFNYPVTPAQQLELFREVATILANVTYSPKNYVSVIREGFLLILKSWAQSDDIQLQSQAKRALANLDAAIKLDREQQAGPQYADGMFLLSSLDTNTQADVDIVFVHGLLGGAFVTWRFESEGESKAVDIGASQKDEANNACWPKDWLAKEMPNARILAVNYQTVLSDWSPASEERNAKTLKERSNELLEKLQSAQVGKDRPVYFVCHSMGGLLVKQILLDSKLQEAQNTLSDNTKGIVFYSTPHYGSWLAQYSEKLKLLLLPSIEVVELAKDSKFLMEQNQKFSKEYKNIDVISVGESLETKIGFDEAQVEAFMSFQSIKNFLGLTEKKNLLNEKEDKKKKGGFGMVIVPIESANPGYGEFVMIEKDHIRVCKPTSQEDPVYLITKNLVQTVNNQKSLNQNM